MANIKLKACDTCGAVTDKADEEFHQRWHLDLEGRLLALAVWVQMPSPTMAREAQ